MKVKYTTKENEELYDLKTIKEKIGINKSKLHRVIKKVTNEKPVKYKNQHLFSQTSLFLIMEEILFERLDKIESKENELSEN